MFIGHRYDLAVYEKLPDLLTSNRFYFNKINHTAFHYCPSGCGNIVTLPIHYEGESKERRERSFDMHVTDDGLVTIKQSILCPKCNTRYLIRSSLSEQSF